jgi:translation initiation factor 3 subunit I
MKPTILQGHSRPIKDLKFNTDGTQLITASNDRNIIIWSMLTGKKSSIFGHNAAVNGFALSKNEDYLFSSDNTGTLYFWDIKGCKISRKIDYDVTLNLKSIESSRQENEELIICLAGRTKNSKSIIDVVNIKDTLKLKADPTYDKDLKTRIRIEAKDQKFTKSKLIDSFEDGQPAILASREDGSVALYNFKNGSFICEKRIHKESILDFDYDNKTGLLLTVSKDGKAIVSDLKRDNIMNSFEAENPKRQLNVCKFSPIVNQMCGDEVLDENLMKFHCIFAGGQDSKTVSSTHTKEGGFEVIMYNLLDDKDVGTISGHFGPINSIAISPDGRMIASGGEDSTVRIHNISDIPIN